MPILLSEKCETAILFSVTRDQDPIFIVKQAKKQKKKNVTLPPNKSWIYDPPIPWTELSENRGSSRKHCNQSIDLSINP